MPLLTADRRPINYAGTFNFTTHYVVGDLVTVSQGFSWVRPFLNRYTNAPTYYISVSLGGSFLCVKEYDEQAADLQRSVMALPGEDVALSRRSIYGDGDNLMLSNTYFEQFGAVGPAGQKGETGTAGPPGVIWAGSYDSTEAYAPTSLVQSGGTIWIAVRQAQPGESPGRSQAWGMFIPGGVQWQGQWKQGTVYYPNDIVLADSKWYVLTANAGSNGFSGDRSPSQDADNWLELFDTSSWGAAEIAINSIIGAGTIVSLTAMVWDHVSRKKKLAKQALDAMNEASNVLRESFRDNLRKAMFEEDTMLHWWIDQVNARVFPPGH